MGFSIYSHKGWFRLWVVASLVFGVVVAYFTLDRFPTERGVTARYKAAAASLNPDRSQLSPRVRGILEERNSPLTQEVLQKESIRLANNYRKDLDELPQRQRELVVQGAVVWFGGSLLAYIAGWLIAWIIRGFRKPQA